jgi:hypothetical protein
MPSFDATCSMVSTINSRSRRSNSVRAPQSKVTKVNVPGIGTATQTPTGDIRVDYKDGSALTVRLLITYLQKYIYFINEKLISCIISILWNFISVLFCLF